MTLPARIDPHSEIGVERPSRDFISRIAHALADPRRYAILKQIAGQRAPVSFGALCQGHEIGSPTMSHHLKLLAEANLIAVMRHGKRTTVALRPEIVDQYLADLGRQLKGDDLAAGS